ncbi:MAG: phosphohistidine-like domain-containing protein, partial [Myxococcota bacterium]
MQRLTSQHDIEIAIDQTLRDGTLEVRIAPNRPTDTVLHWGATRKNSNTWHRPPRGWPDGSEAFGEGAVRTSLHGHSEAKPVVMRFDEDAGFTHLAFVLHDPGRDAWDDNGGRNYQVPLQSAQPDRPPLQAARELASAAAEEVLSEFESPMGDATLAVVVAKHGPEGARLAIVTDQPGDLWLHWGVAPDRHQRWSVPPEALLPSNTKVVSDAAVRSPFAYHKGLQSLAVEIPDASSMMGLSFVLYDAQANRWFKRKGGDFFVRLSADPSGTEALDGLAQTIVDHEMNRGSWTLMHRYNLAHGLIEDLAPGDREGLGLAYVWLRYSALRQLDWQRNYNTKPRELAHAQDRLTRLLARRYTQDAAVRDIVRWILPTIGRGGEGQRVRDEILEIMHRHHIKEVAGRFMEQWHQKLHNNTTYDDVVICKAYLAFLLGNGDKEAFYGTLEANGVTRERLQGFERPITEEPDFVPHLRDGLLHDFNSFLRTLKSVHDGLDLESALHTANHALGDLQEHAWSVWKQRRSDDVLGLARSITLLRERLSSRLLDERVARDLLSLDVALENQLRVVLERSSSVRQDEQALAKLIPLILRNLALSWSGDEELALCVRQWEKLEGQADAGTLGALRTQAAVDRTARALVDHVDGVYAQLQPKAELLGRAFGADSWTVELFSEEAVRGRLEFVVGMLLRRLDALLRRRAGIQGCRVVSRGLGAARGRVLVEKDLRALQGKAIDGPVVVICDHVSGDEELPASVAAVLTADGVDLVSHVAVRARNSGLVMVT